MASCSAAAQRGPSGQVVGAPTLASACAHVLAKTAESATTRITRVLRAARGSASLGEQAAQAGDHLVVDKAIGGDQAARVADLAVAIGERGAVEIGEAAAG